MGEKNDDIGGDARALQKITLYGCPSEDCLYTTGDPQKMSEHVNENHDGEWDDDDWPDLKDHD